MKFVNCGWNKPHYFGKKLFIVHITCQYEHDTEKVELGTLNSTLRKMYVDLPLLSFSCRNIVIDPMFFSKVYYIIVVPTIIIVNATII